MITTKINIGLIALTLFLTSCNNFFKTTVELDVPEHKSKLAITSLMNNNGDTNPIIVSYSIGGLEQSENNQLLDNAAIAISYENESISFSLTENHGIYTADENINFTPNTEYKIVVDAPSYETVSSVQTFPETIEIIEAIIDENTIKVRFKDTPNKRNYYILELDVTIDNLWESNEISPFGDSAYLSSSGEGIIFNDDTFDGNIHEITANYNTSIEIEGDLIFKFKLYNITEDYYRYDRTLSIQQGANDNPFTEPIIIHRNIDKGYGIFALGNKSELEVPYE